MEDEYICSLTKVTEKKAKEELNEDPRDRLNAVEAFRQWVVQQPHLKARTDTKTLLTFLRGAKFSQLRAREMYDRYLTMITQHKTWFTNIDPQDPQLQAVIDSGYMIPLPKKDNNGCQVLLYRMNAMKSEGGLYSFDATLRAGHLLTSFISMDENIQVNGFVMIFDYTGMTMKHMTHWKFDDVIKWHNCMQNNVPGRFKRIHIYNAGSFFETLAAMMRPFLKKKFQDRMMMHANMESLYNEVPLDMLPLEYLPDDYKGPSAGPLETLIKNFKKAILKPECRDYLLSWTSDEYGVDELKRQTAEPQESFRRLNVE